MNMDVQAVKKIIREELPRLVKSDPYIREMILQLSQEESGAESSGKPLEELEARFEQRLGLILKHLKRNTENHTRRMDENRQEIKKIREEISRNLAEIERIYKLLDLMDQDNELSLGNLKVTWGY
jgi:uncharacterized protein YaaN involved in tellurite resistance